MSLPDAAAEFARQLAAALSGETDREQRVRRTDVEQHEERAEQEIQRRMRAERERDEAVAEIKAWARSAEKAREQRDDLLHAARAVTRPSSWTATRMTVLREVVDRIEKELNGS